MAQHNLGELLIKEGLVTEQQLGTALQIQRAQQTYKPLGQILVEQRVITRKQLDLFLDFYAKRPQLGDILLRSKAITQSELDLALEHQKTTGLPLGEMLLRLNLVTEEVMRNALCVQLNIPFVDLDKLVIDQSLTQLINKNYARTHSVVPIGKSGNSVTVAMDDPTDAGVIEELQSFTGFTVNVVTSTRATIKRAFARVYEEKSAAEAAAIAERIELMVDTEAEPVRGRRTLRYAENEERTKTADEIVRQLISVALRHRATDVHLETLGHRVLTRFRIDGLLRDLDLGPVEEAVSEHAKEILSRIKILGKLDIAERRRPQDGSFRARVDKGGDRVHLDFRISIIPGYYGESAVLRILDPRNAPRAVSKLGLSKPVTDRLLHLLKRTTGIILITGPTGAGKSTTLYACLMTLYRPEIRILTAEDPIEYVYDHFSQSEVNEKIGNTFANYIRAFLRHDPEVMMVGEIRDEETAQMAFRAAQTGHLLLSTMHTNDAVGAVMRLLNLGAEPSLITSSLLAVLAQRLVREVCASCKQEYRPSDELLREFFDVPPRDFAWYRGRGCVHCSFTGYKGRMALSELWVPSDEDVILINKGAPFDEIRTSSRRSTLPMAAEAMEKLREGRTNLEELIRMLPYSAIYQCRQFSTA